jgi:hypothetical protein
VISPRPGGTIGGCAEALSAAVFGFRTLGAGFLLGVFVLPAIAVSFPGAPQCEGSFAPVTLGHMSVTGAQPFYLIVTDRDRGVFAGPMSGRGETPPAMPATRSAASSATRPAGS